MRPDEVVTLLESRVAEEFHARDDGLLLDAIKAKLPITDDTDLMRYGFNDTRVLSRPSYVAAALLESGSASVVDLWAAGEGRTLPNIVAMRLEGGGIWRDFCEPTGQSILFVTDEIAD